jgi:hypothetical protein
MKKISLTADQKETRLSHHKKCCDKRECDRIKAVLLYAKDWSIASIADALLLHETSITRHINDFWETYLYKRWLSDHIFMQNEDGCFSIYSKFTFKRAWDDIRHLAQRV